MIRIPDVHEVKQMGDELGFAFTAKEAEQIHVAIARLFPILDAVEVPFEEESLPLRFPERDRGRRPTPEEDPLNAFITKCRVKGADEGPLAGRAVGLKDTIAVAGVPLTLGSRFMEGYIPDFDATIVTRLLDAGATIVGKLNMDPFGMGAYPAGTRDFGRVLNPHNHASSPGGSSSGSGATVAGRIHADAQELRARTCAYGAHPQN